MTASTSPLALNLTYLLFLLVPGYLTLRGYLRARIKLDTLSRLDKFLITIGGGVYTLLIVLILNRFGLLSWLVDSWFSLWTGGGLSTKPLHYRSETAITPSSIPEHTILSFLGFMTAQSLIGYASGFGWGRWLYYKSDTQRQSSSDLEQPWETAVRQSAQGDQVTIITKRGREIRGRLYRIGSPSENFDILLNASEEVYRTGHHEFRSRPLGITYHHYEDISQIQFPEITPETPEPKVGKIISLCERYYDMISYVRRNPEYLFYRIHYWNRVPYSLQAEAKKACTIHRLIEEHNSHRHR